MSMTKKQLAVIDALQNGGWIWKAGNTTFLALKDGDKVTSRPLHKRTFEGLLEAQVIKPVDGNKFTLA